MKKPLFFLFTLFAIAATHAANEPVITLTTDKTVGETLEFRAYCASADIAFTVDWGDGQPKSYSVDPNGWGFQQWTEGEIKGNTIKITGPVVLFSCEEMQLSSFTLENQTSLADLSLSENNLTELTIPAGTPLKDLDVSKNQIEHSGFNPKFNIEGAAGTLENLNASNNKLTNLNLNKFSSLIYFNASYNPELNTVVFYDGSTALKQITLNDCDIVHFYAISLPNVTKIDLGNNSLTEFEQGSYPNLSTLNLQGNMISEIDVTKFPHLYSFYCSNNALTSINVANNPELVQLSCSNNDISSIDLSNNTSLTSLYVNGNSSLSRLDITKIRSIKTLDISNTNISFIDLTNAPFLNTFTAQNTKCEFFYFNYVQPEVLQKIDIRNNPQMTAQSLNVMYKTMPIHKETYSTVPTLLLEGSNAEHSNTSYPTSQDMQWISDVTGDGSITNTNVDITVKDADSGEKIHVEGYFGGDILNNKVYDFTKYDAENGSYYIAQWTGDYYQNLRDITTAAEQGAPMMIVDTPSDGFKFKSVTVNGKEYFQKWFITNETAEIKVNFEATAKSISFTTGVGQDLSFALYADKSNTPIELDWGNGALQQYSIGTTVTRIDGVAMGETITIHGDVTEANFESYGEYGELMGLWNNKITGIDVSKNSELRSLNLYFNPISTLDISNLSQLTDLDISMTEALTELDVTNNTKLVSLTCYGNLLSSLDVSKNTELVSLDAHNNSIAQIDLSNNAKIKELVLTNNQLASIDLSHLESIETLSIAGNLLTAIDLSANKMLNDLNVGRNLLNGLDLSNNLKLQMLSFNDNNIHSIKLDMLPDIRIIDCGGNGMTACELDDFYFNLPIYPIERDPEDKGATLTLLTGSETTPNDARNSDTAIASEKGWICSLNGNASGCDEAVVIIEQSLNGSIKLTDADGKEILSGSKAKKNSPITIEPLPDNGFRLDNVTVNGTVVEGLEFTIARLTKVLASFIKDAGVDNVAPDGVSIAGKNDEIVVTTPIESSVEVYNMNGANIVSTLANGETIIPATKGFYIIKVTNQHGTMARVVAVK